jgi:hypothetical protein
MGAVWMPLYRHSLAMLRCSTDKKCMDDKNELEQEHKFDEKNPFENAAR